MRKFLSMFRFVRLSMKEKISVISVGLMTLIMIPAVAFAGAELDTGVDFIDGLGDKVINLITFLYFLVVSWMSIKFLKDKAYGQFWGFLLVAVVIYAVIFQQENLKSITEQIGGLFDGSSNTGVPSGTVE